MKNLIKTKPQIGIVIFLITTISILFSGYKALTYSGGPPAGNTGAPGENNCTSCHSGNVITSGTNWGNINLSTDIPTTGYIPDSTYNITLSHTQTGINKFGFQLTVLETTNDTKTGTLIITNSSKTKLGSSSTRSYVMHSNGGTSGNGSNNWTFQWKAPSINVGSIKMYAAINAANNNGQTSGDQIYTKDWTFGASSLLPVASITILNNTVCVGDTVFLYGGGTNNPTVFNWDFPGGNPTTSTLQDPYVVYNSSGTKTITLTVENNKGKSIAKTAQVNIISKPQANISVNGPTIICFGDSVQLTANSGNGFSYLWNTNETTRSIYVKQAGTYNVQVSNSNNCSRLSADVKIQVDSLQPLTINSNLSNDSICQGDSLIFTASSGFSKYSFYNSSTLLQQSSSNILHFSNFNNSNTIYAIAQNINNCSNQSDSIEFIQIESLTNPILSCGEKTTSSIQIIWDTVAGANSYEFSTDSGKTWNSINQNKYIFSNLDYNQEVSLHVRAIKNGICGIGPESHIACSSLPCESLSYSIFYDSLVCSYDTVKVEIRNLKGSKYAISYDKLPFSKDTFYYSTIQNSGTIQIQIIDSSALNCPIITENLFINLIKPNKADLISNKLSNSFCEGDTIILKASSGYKNYTFHRNNDLAFDNSTDSIFTLLVFDSGDTLFTITEDQFGCIDTSNEIIIDVNPLPLVGFTYNQNWLDFEFEDTTSFVFERLWNFWGW